MFSLYNIQIWKLYAVFYDFPPTKNLIIKFINLFELKYSWKLFFGQLLKVILNYTDSLYYVRKHTSTVEHLCPDFLTHKFKFF